MEEVMQEEGIMVLENMHFFKREVRNKLTKKVTFEQRFEGSKRIKQGHRKENIPSRQKSKYRDLESKVFLVCSRRRV